MSSPYFYAVVSNLFWGLGAQFYTRYARKFSSVWVNALKASLSAFFFLCVILLSGGFHYIGAASLSAFLISGFLGLGIADIFLIKAFKGMGPGRTMMLYAFQPLFVGVVSFYLFGQTINAAKFISIIFFIVCIMIFSVETYRKEKHFNVKNTFYALCGIMFDGAGVLFTRYAFDNSLQTSTFEGNFYRAASATLFFIILSRWIKFNLFANFKSLNRSGKTVCVAGVFFGTFLSLAFYLKAVQAGNLAVVTSIAVTGVIFAAVFESVFEHKRPSKYLYWAFLFFACGMYFLLF